MHSFGSSVRVSWSLLCFALCKVPQISWGPKDELFVAPKVVFGEIFGHNRLKS